MKLIVGLGNPGSEYNNTRHNIGFAVIDSIAKSLDITFSENNKFRSEIATGFASLNKVILSKPSTFMNLSGQAVQLTSHYYKINISDIIVIHDDIDLPIGTVKIKTGGGNGGHNGLKSIDNCLGANYTRIRIGIGRPAHKDDVANYVLSYFSSAESVIMNEITVRIKENFALILDNKVDEFNLKIKTH